MPNNDKLTPCTVNALLESNSTMRRHIIGVLQCTTHIIKLYSLCFLKEETIILYNQILIAVYISNIIALVVFGHGWTNSHILRNFIYSDCEDYLYT